MKQRRQTRKNNLISIINCRMLRKIYHDESVVVLPTYSQSIRNLNFFTESPFQSKPFSIRFEDGFRWDRLSKHMTLLELLFSINNKYNKRMVHENPESIIFPGDRNSKKLIITCNIYDDSLMSILNLQKSLIQVAGEL